MSAEEASTSVSAEDSHHPPMALQTLSESVKALRSLPSVSLDTKLSEVRSKVNALMPLVSLPVWLPFSFMFSILSYIMVAVMQALDMSDPSGAQWSNQKLEALKLHRVGSSPNLTSGLNTSSSIHRALDQVLELITCLPSSSTKYSFTRNLIEQLLMDNTSQKPPLSDVNRTSLTKAFRRTVEQLEMCLARGAGVSGAFNSIVRRCTQAAGWASALAAPPELAQANPGTALRADKLSQELCWLTYLLFEYGGGLDALRLWVHSPNLAEAARFASPRVQSNLVKLAAMFVRASAGLEWTVTAVIPRKNLDGSPTRSLGHFASDPVRGHGGPPESPAAWAPLDLQYRLLLLWLPLMCRAFHSGDGPIFSTAEKQRTEEALQQTILKLGHSEQEVLLASWLQEYSWSSSDWPNLQSQYLAWCERARRVASVSEHVLE